MADHIFISYSRSDEAEVRKLYNDLVAAGVNCWLDVERIPSGANWDQMLQEAVETCIGIIIVCTPTSMGSQNVRAEWQYAFDLQKPLFPLLMKPCDIPFRLRIYQFTDVAKLGYETALKTLVASLPDGSAYSVEPTPISEESAEKKMQSLVDRAVLNWKSFGLLLDREAFDHIDGARDNLVTQDADVLTLLFLSARRNRISKPYWMQRLKENMVALDRVEDILIDDVSAFSFERQLEFEEFSSARLLVKVSRLMEMTRDSSAMRLLLDSVERVLLKTDATDPALRALEQVFLKRFEEDSNESIARALGWINSQVFYDEALNKLQKEANPLDPACVELYPYIHGMAYMTTEKALEYLRSLTPDGFTFIPAGWFVMGADNSRDPSIFGHTVFVPSVWLSTTEVTNDDFWRYRGDTHSQRGAFSGHVKADQASLGTLPQQNISWHQAMEYCKWLRSQWNLPTNLPTEAMWEKAASWDPVQLRKLRFPWGDEVDATRCNTVESQRGESTPVGSFSPVGDSPYGLHDMIGNVWEWTSSALYPYPYHSRDGREDEVQNMRVARGSSFRAKRGFMTGCTTRIAFEENYAFDDAGLRVALVVAR